MFWNHFGRITKADKDIANGYRDGAAAGIRSRLDGIHALSREMLAGQRQNQREWRKKMAEVDDALARLQASNANLIAKSDQLIEGMKGIATQLRALAGSGDANHALAVALNDLADKADAETTKEQAELDADGNPIPPPTAS